MTYIQVPIHVSIRINDQYFLNYSKAISYLITEDFGNGGFVVC